VKTARLAVVAFTMAGCGAMLASGGSVREERDNSEGVTALRLGKMSVPTSSGLTTISVTGSVVTAVNDPKQVEIMQVNPNLVRLVFHFGDHPKPGQHYGYFDKCEGVVFSADGTTIDSGRVDGLALIDDTVVALFPRAEFGQLADASGVTLKLCGSAIDLAPEQVANFKALAAAAKRPLSEATAAR
jgi:hypothetical protein